MEDDLHSLLIIARSLEGRTARANKFATIFIRSLEQRLLDPSIRSLDVICRRVLNIVAAIAVKVRAIRQKVDAAALEDVRSLEVVPIRESLSVHLEELVHVAGPLHTLLCAAVADLAQLEPDFGSVRLVHDVLLAIVVFEPRRINHSGLVALLEVVDGFVYTRDGVADGGADAVALGTFGLLGRFFVRREVPSKPLSKELQK